MTAAKASQSSPVAQSSTALDPGLSVGTNMRHTHTPSGKKGQYLKRRQCMPEQQNDPGQCPPAPHLSFSEAPRAESWKPIMRP